MLKTRLTQMKIVERAVRPVRAGTLRKRKMREELLAPSLGDLRPGTFAARDPAAALEVAARRFGDPVGTGAELGSRPALSRANQLFRRAMGGVPGTRVGGQVLDADGDSHVLLLAVILGLVLSGVYLRYGWIDDVQTLARVFAAIVLLTPPAQFAAWLAYIKMRDAMWGAFGSRKSLARVLVLDVLIGVLAATLLFSVSAIVRLDFASAAAALPLCGIVGLTAALLSLLLARLSGPGEIRDTHWAVLEIETA